VRPTVDDDILLDPHPIVQGALDSQIILTGIGGGNLEHQDRLAAFFSEAKRGAALPLRNIEEHQDIGTQRAYSRYAPIDPAIA
jgi:hypothetical protein